MPFNTTEANADLDNDYVAQVLASEARDSSLKYSTQGLGAYLPKRPTGAAPKPNTRFLRNIIKETDSHNASLKRKEEREARERMRQLRGQVSASARDDRAHDRHRLRMQSDDARSRGHRREDRDERHRTHRERYGSTSASPDRDRPRRHRRTHESRGTDETYDRSSRKERRRRSTSRSRSPRRERSDARDRHRHRKRTRSLSRSHSSSPVRHGSRRGRLDYRNREDGGRKSNRNTHDDRSPRRHKHTRDEISIPRTSASQQKESGYGSDPLEELVGPLPPKQDGLHGSGPIRSRGRGAYRPNASNIDAHFADDYDPTLDVQLEDDNLIESSRPSRRPVAGLMTGDDDWELALEALRDRTRWRQKGEERLREAGFNNAVVDRWKHSSSAPGGDDEGRLEDVKWSKKGEGREWDRGKFVDADGHVDVKASW